jgi:hypothetical protein
MQSWPHVSVSCIGSNENQTAQENIELLIFHDQVDAPSVVAEVQGTRRPSRMTTS